MKNCCCLFKTIFSQLENTVIHSKDVPQLNKYKLGDIVMFTGENSENFIKGHYYIKEKIANNVVWTDITSSGGGGEGGNLPYQIIASRQVGGIDVGNSYPAGTPLAQIFKEMLSPTNYPTLTPPSATISGTGDKLLEKGSTINATITITLNRGQINPAYGTSGYRSGAATGYSLNGGTQQAGNQFNVTINESNFTFTGRAYYGAGEQPKDSVGNDYQTPLPAGSVNTSSSLTYEFVDALWSNTSDIATVAKLPLVSKSAGQYVFQFPAATAANPEAFDVATSWNITALEVKNELTGAYEDCTPQFTVSDVEHEDAAGRTVNYKRYTCNLGYNMGARDIRIKWS